MSLGEGFFQFVVESGVAAEPLEALKGGCGRMAGIILCLIPSVQAIERERGLFLESPRIEASVSGFIAGYGDALGGWARALCMEGG